MKMAHTKTLQLFMAGICGLAAASAHGQIVTTVTTDSAILTEALRPTGLTITSIRVRKGTEGQIGTYQNFFAGPVTIRGGIVLSSGNVSTMGPLAEAQLPDYDPASPPIAVNSAMDMIDGGGTPEFDAYGNEHHNIESFDASYDVAALEVTFDLAEATGVKFDFIFGSVEFPFWTGDFTDAFLVFLDGTSPDNQITFDDNDKPVQVGRSFAGLETTNDVNTAFGNPHGLIHHLTTTTETLSAGRHTLLFEVGDVNDQALDSAVFITNLRTGPGANTGGHGHGHTDSSEDCPADFNSDSTTDFFDYLDFVDALSSQTHRGDFNEDESIDFFDYLDFVDAYSLGCD